MARRTNYKFERLQRERNKAAKKAARQKIKEERSEQRKAEQEGLEPTVSDAGETEPGIE